MVAGISILLLVVLILGIIAIVFGIITNAVRTAPFWFYTSFWVTALALLYHH